MAASFPRPNAHSEGLVIEFTDNSGDRWVGNFARGHGIVCDVRDELGEKAIIVVACGAGYVVDARARCLTRELNGGITGIWYRHGLRAMIVTNGVWFEAFDASTMLWKSRRLSWDGVRAVEFSAVTVRGEAYSPFSDDWAPFEVSLSDGEVVGGSYTGPPM